MPRVSEQCVRDHFYAHGEIWPIRMVLQSMHFMTYTRREGGCRRAFLQAGLPSFEIDVKEASEDKGG
ncbi:hypothetical protein DsansV1_C13g0120571 [Dioscorea sansibarensis]